MSDFIESMIIFTNTTRNPCMYAFSFYSSVKEANFSTTQHTISKISLPESSFDFIEGIII